VQEATEMLPVCAAVVVVPGGQAVQPPASGEPGEVTAP